MALDLQEMDIFAAERFPCCLWDIGSNTESSDVVFPSYFVRRTGDNLLKDCCRLRLKVERNLDRYGQIESLFLGPSFDSSFIDYHYTRVLIFWES